jgi:hypothetical protein
VTAPNGGDNLTCGTQTLLTWSATDNGGAIATVDLSVSLDNGGIWTPIATGVANSGAYLWTPTAPGTNTGASPVYTALFRVEAEDGVGNPGSDDSNAPFSIFDPSTPTLVTHLDAVADDDGLRIQWQLDPNITFASLALERADNTVGPWNAIAADPTHDGALTVVVDRSVTPGRAYWYRLVATTAAGAHATFGPIQGQALERVTQFSLSTVTPNPTPGAFRVDFAVAREARIHLALHDVQGRKIAVLADGVYRPGRYRAQWDGVGDHGKPAVGVYFLVFDGAGQHFSRRVAITH